MAEVSQVKIVKKVKMEGNFRQKRLCPRILFIPDDVPLYLTGIIVLGCRVL